MELDSVFDSLAAQISPPDGHFAKAITRAERIGNILERDSAMEVAFTEVGGSCGKQTAVIPLNDADLFVYLEPDGLVSTRGTPYVPATVLRLFEDRVEHAYRSHVDADRVRIRRQDHSLRVELQSERSVSVDVVPVRWEGREDGVAWVPDRTTGEWRRTSPRRQQELLDTLDIRNRAVRRAIRLLKIWRVHHRLPFRSYALEVLVLHAAYNDVPKHPRTLLFAALEHIVATKLREPVIIPEYEEPEELARAAVHIIDPAVADNNVADNINANERAHIVSCARDTLADFERAEDALDRGLVPTAGRALKSALGATLS